MAYPSHPPQLDYSNYAADKYRGNKINSCVFIIERTVTIRLWIDTRYINVAGTYAPE
jgi:hypothetical protein